MTDYLGPLSFGQSGTYRLTRRTISAGEAQLELIVQAASADGLAAALEALVAQLRSGNTYTHSEPGVTSAVAYQVVGVSGFRLGDKPHRWLAFYERVAFTLSLSSAPSGALTTLYNSQHVDAPASLSLAALLGTNPAALDVRVDDDSGNDMHSVWCALAPAAVTNSLWLVLASALTWTTMSNGTGADMWGNVSRYTTSASYQTASLDTSRYPEGKYRLLARVKQSAGTGYVKDSQNDTAVAVTRTTPHLVVVGDLDLPAYDTAPGTAAPVTLSVKSDGVNTCTVNGFVLLPLSWGMFRWHPDVATTELDQLEVGPSGTFVDGVCDTTYLRGGPLVPKVLAAHVGTLVATSQPSGSVWPADWYASGATVTASSNRFQLSPRGTANSCYYAATVTGTPLAVPGAWYEFSFTRYLYAYTSGSATASVVWLDVDGNTVREDVVETVSAAGASTPVVYYLKAPVHAVRARPKFATITTPAMDNFISAVVLRRCPLHLIVVAEDAGGALASNVHPVHVTVAYTPRYEVSR